MYILKKKFYNVLFKFKKKKEIYISSISCLKCMRHSSLLFLLIYNNSRINTDVISDINHDKMIIL